MSFPVVTHAAEKTNAQNRTICRYCRLLPPRFFRNFRQIKEVWRKRVGVEPTIRLARSRIAGFEGRDSHRTIFASARIITADHGLAKQSNLPHSLATKWKLLPCKEGIIPEGNIAAQPFAAPTFLRASSRSLGWTHTSKYGRFVGPPILPPAWSSRVIPRRITIGSSESPNGNSP